MGFTHIVKKDKDIKKLPKQEGREKNKQVKYKLKRNKKNGK